MSFIFDSTQTGSAELDLHLEHVRSFDWATTSLGPLASWPQDLLQLAHVMMLDPQPRLLLLGAHNWMLYNPAYATAVAGDKHPKLLGQTQVEGWSAEVEESVIDAPNSIRDSGMLPGSVHDYHIPLMRNGFLEECVMSWNTIPLAGALTGFYISLTDVTEAHILERRKTTLSQLEKVCGSAQSIEAMWEAVPQCLSSNLFDCRHVLLFAVDSDGYHLEQSTSGLEKNQAQMRALEESNSLMRAAASNKPLLIKSEEMEFQESWKSIFDSSDPRDAILVCPLSHDESKKIVKQLVIGMSARNPYNDDWHSWILQLMQVLSESITSLTFAEEERQRRLKVRADALERAQASEKETSEITERLLKMHYIVEQVDVGIFEILPSGVLTQTNDAYHKISGIPKTCKGSDEFRFMHYIYPEDAEHVTSQWGTLNSGKATTFEMRWKAPVNEHGEPFQWVLAACTPLLDSTGTVASIYGCITDIGAQKRAESDNRSRADALELLRVSEQRFYKFMEHAPVAVIVSTKDRQTSYVNSHWFDLTGHPRTNDFSKLDWAGLVYEEDLHIVIDVWDTILKGDPATIEFRLKVLRENEDGQKSYTWVQAMVWPEFDLDGELKQTIGTMLDISHFKEMEGQSRVRVEQAIEARRQQENFIDMTSHEIRNPLSAVVHCVDSISDSLDEMETLVTALMASPEQDKAKQLHEYIDGSKDAANTIKSCTAHQKRIVDDILVLSKLDSNLLQIAPSRVEAMSILTKIDKMFEAEAARECVNVTVQADPSLITMNIDWLLLDHGRIDQVLINLITNAIKFTKNRDTRNIVISMGSSTKRPSETDLEANFNVDFTLGQSLRDSIYDTPEFAENELYLWFAVQDTGRGITQAERSRIFGRFQQASPRTYSEYGGSGLGLYISHSLVGLQGGEIGVATESGVGSTFSFFVKTSRCAAPSLQAAEMPPSLKKARIDTTTTNASRRISVLIVEDNLLNLRVLKKQLTKNYDVSTAEHGQEALNFLKSTERWHPRPSGGKVQIDIILMDLEMPVMGGLECSRRIRELQKAGQIRGHVPIIAVSANARPEQIQQALDAGMDDAIAKPFRIPDLIPKIERLVSRSR